MRELLGEIPRWIIEFGLLLAVCLWVLQFFLKALPFIKNHGVKGRLMKAEAQISALTIETQALKHLHQQVEDFLREQIEYYKIEHVDTSEDRNEKIVDLMEHVTKTEKKLRASRNLMQAFLDHTPFVMAVKDRNNKYLMVNKALCDITGKSKEEIIGKTIWDFHPEIAPVIDENDQKARSSNTASETTFTFMRDDREITHFIMAFPILASDGDEGMIGIVNISKSDYVSFRGEA